MTHVMVVDDDPHLRQLVRHDLEREGYAVHEAAGGAEALAAPVAQTADLFIIDVMMPGMDGWELCERLRQISDKPVLMLTARGRTGEKVKGLRLGADDYLVKPFDASELRARIGALLRRYRIAASKAVDVGRLRLDRSSFTVEAAGERLTLPPKEFELLFHLGSYEGRTLTREQLIEQLWGYDYAGDERTVDVHVKRLRDRFPEDRYGFRIRTVRGIGYRLETGL